MSFDRKNPKWKDWPFYNDSVGRLLLLKPYKPHSGSWDDRINSMDTTKGLFNEDQYPDPYVLKYDRYHLEREDEIVSSLNGTKASEADANSLKRVPCADRTVYLSQEEVKAYQHQYDYWQDLELNGPRLDRQYYNPTKGSWETYKSKYGRYYYDLLKEGESYYRGEERVTYKEQVFSSFCFTFTWFFIKLPTLVWWSGATLLVASARGIDFIEPLLYASLSVCVDVSAPLFLDSLTHYSLYFNYYNHSYRTLLDLSSGRTHTMFRVDTPFTGTSAYVGYDTFMYEFYKDKSLFGPGPCFRSGYAEELVASERLPLPSNDYGFGPLALIGAVGGVFVYCFGF